MLGDKDVCGVIAVKDINVGVKFYQDTLGLKKEKDDPTGILFSSGNSKLFIYPTEFAGTNKATAVAWNVDNVDEIASALKAKGITLEHYDNLPGVKLEGDVHIFGPARAIWFKDPDGNILNVVSGM